MRDVISNVMRLEPQNLIPQVFYLAGLLWLVVVLCAFFSVRSQAITRFAKVIWMVVIVLMPMVGLLAYCGFCLTRLQFDWFPGASSSLQGPSGGVGRVTSVTNGPVLTIQPTARIESEQDDGSVAKSSNRKRGEA